MNENILRKKKIYNDVVLDRVSVEKLNKSDPAVFNLNCP